MQTKEQLIKELAIQEARTNRQETADIFLRQEFAKAFAWHQNSPYKSDGVRTPSWEEIFVKVGRLLFEDDLGGIKESLTHLELVTGRLQSELNPTSNPK